MPNSKLLQLLPLALTRPIEFLDRVATSFEVRADRVNGKGAFGSGIYGVSEWEDAVSHLEAYIGPGSITSALAEPELAEIETEVHKRTEAKLGDAPFSLAHCSDKGLARFCYALIRATKPEVALETGVGFGVTSAFILKALEVNRRGILHSIDLPPLGRDADKFVGILIPEHLRERWNLHRGPTRRVLPRVLPEIGPVGLFLHDSLHTYRTMSDEFRTVMPYLKAGAILIADDIQDNAAFSEWVMENKPAFSAVIHEPDKNCLFGLAARHCPEAKDNVFARSI